ncbi:MAG: YHS domain-containing protein [bacterium]
MAEEKLDPVCGMTVTEENAACSYEFNGKKYYFCADACRDTFAENPDRYVRNRS